MKNSISLLIGTSLIAIWIAAVFDVWNLWSWFKADITWTWSTSTWSTTTDSGSTTTDTWSTTTDTWSTTTTTDTGSTTTDTWSTTTDTSTNVSQEEIDAIRAQLEQELLEYLWLFTNTSVDDIPEDEFWVAWYETLSHNVRVRIEEIEENEREKAEEISEIEYQKQELANRFNVLQAKLDVLEWWSEEEVELTEEEEKIQSEEEARLAAKVQLVKDTDWDGLSDHIETIIDTNIMLLDTDGDWYSDYDEITNWSNPKWHWPLYSDISENSPKASVIKRAIKKWLVFKEVWTSFNDEIITRQEATKMIVSAHFPYEIYLNSPKFSWILVYNDLNEDKYYPFLRYFRIAQYNNQFDWIIWYRFLPEWEFTRAEFLKVLIAWFWKLDNKQSYEWIDSEKTNWFTPYFSSAKEKWVLETPLYSRVRPLDKVSRYEAVKFLINTIDYKKSLLDSDEEK